MSLYTIYELRAMAATIKSLCGKPPLNRAYLKAVVSSYISLYDDLISYVQQLDVTEEASEGFADWIISATDDKLIESLVDHWCEYGG